MEPNENAKPRFKKKLGTNTCWKRIYILKYKKTHKFMTKNYTIQIKIKNLFVIYNNLNDFILNCENKNKLNV